MQRGGGLARTCLPCKPPSTERCLVFCSPVLAPTGFVSSGRLFETGAAGAGEAAGSAIVVMAPSLFVGEALGGTEGGEGNGTSKLRLAHRDSFAESVCVVMYGTLQEPTNHQDSKRCQPTSVPATMGYPWWLANPSPKLLCLTGFTPHSEASAHCPHIA